jgi:hypothetical protein
MYILVVLVTGSLEAALVRALFLAQQLQKKGIDISERLQCAAAAATVSNCV